jgi:hypothetical protein
MWIIDFLCGRKLKETNSEVDVVLPTNDIMFSVENFNRWFVDPNNRAVYANRGIFLRLDKLSVSHIEDYLEKEFGIDRSSSLYENSSLYLLIMEFHEEIRKDWRKSLNK